MGRTVHVSIRHMHVGFVALAPRAGLLGDAMERAWIRQVDWRQMGQVATRRIGELVPSDPVGVFAEELTRLIRGVGSAATAVGGVGDSQGEARCA